MAINWTRFKEIISSHQRFLLTSHIRPDCDALGSELGMAGILEGLGKDVVIVNGHKTPPNLQFIDPGKKIKVIGADLTKSDLEDREVVMILDTSAWAQLGDMGDVLRSTRALKLVLDHHVSADNLGAEEFKDTSSEATGRLVYEAARQLGQPITQEIAFVLLAAISTDTGWFRFASTTGDTYRVAGALLDAGAQPHVLYKSLYEQDSLARIQLIGRTLARAEADLAGRLITSSILQADFAATHALPSDTEDIINMMLAVGGVEVAVIFVELACGGVKVSFRSRTPRVECNRVAENFQGGGHKAAAGATVNEPIAAVQARVLDVVRNAMR